MSHPLAEIFRHAFRPLEPVTTEEQPVLPALDDIAAVLFDVYGTLFISASGEVGTTKEAAVETALSGALAALGIDARGPLAQGVDLYVSTIEAQHAEMRQQGVDFPEIQVAEIWGVVLTELARRGTITASACEGVDLQRLAVEYEARANPCWPMPHLRQCLRDLTRRGILLGIVSNAQFYTPLLFEALLDAPTESWGFHSDLLFFSYQHGHAKPGAVLYRRAVERLSALGVEPSSVLYVGNDMLNDILPAAQVGFRTALFAGDARSLRRRQGDPRVAGLSPDVVLTDLAEVLECIISRTALDAPSLEDDI